jgi:trk/ktr system potassium uptake protein
MHHRHISRILGAYLFVFCGILAVPLAVAAYYEFVADPVTHPQPHSTVAFGLSILVCALLGTFCRWFGRGSRDELYRRDALALVASIWFLTGLVASLPFSFSKTLENPLDSYFETISGLTTTGASVMQAKQYNDAGEEIPIEHVVLGSPSTFYSYYGTITPVRNPETGEIVLEGLNAVSRAILFWRSLLQWLGGVGIVLLFLAILPALGVGGKVLYQAEATGPLKDALTPRIKSSAGLLWKTYLILTIIQILLLMGTNRRLLLLDAVTIAFSTISTGGFSIRPNSIGFYQNPWTDNIVLVFMLVGSINFALWINLARRKLSSFRDPELLVYLTVVLLSSLTVATLLVGVPQLLLTTQATSAPDFTFWSGLRYGAFNLISAISTTGFATANFDMWPFGAQVILLIFMFSGGMSGSTAGGIKIIRESILVRSTLSKIQSLFRPHRVNVTRIGHSRIDPDKVTTIFVFFFLVVVFAIVGTFIMVLDDIDPITALSMNACFLGNVGFAFRMAGPTQSFAFLPATSEVVSILWMVAGRLEYFALLVIFLPDFWRRR